MPTTRWPPSRRGATHPAPPSRYRSAPAATPVSGAGRHRFATGGASAICYGAVVELDRVARETAASELLSVRRQGWSDSRRVDVGGLLRDACVISSADRRSGAEFGADVRSAHRSRDPLRSPPGRWYAQTVVDCPDGRFVIRDLVVRVVADDRPDRVGASDMNRALEVRAAARHLAVPVRW